MAFQVKSFLSITASMINRMRATTTLVTDYNVGSVVRTMLEAVAQECDQLYQQMVNAVKDAIQTATYITFSFNALPAVSASGVVLVVITPQTAAQSIPAGTTFTASTGISYTAIAAATISIGATSAAVQVVATSSGITGNIAANTSFTLSAAPTGFQGATNPAAFSNGAPVESAAERKLRFQVYIVNLARSTTDGIEYGLKTAQLTDSNGNITERVVSAHVDEPYLRDNTQPVGLYFGYIHNGVGGTSGNLVAAAQQVINGYKNPDGSKVRGYKAAGTVCTVMAATEQALQVVGVLTVAQGYDKPTVLQAVEQGLTSYILALGIGEAALRAKLDELAMDVPGVVNFVLSSPLADVTPAFNAKLMPAAPSIA
jgi:uncharacterized phage protein gp47/JayE